MGGGRNSKQRQCHPEVKRLCDLAKGGKPHLCHKKSNGSLLSGRVINSYLQSFGPGYGTESRPGITTEPNALNDDDEEYLVCAN